MIKGRLKRGNAMFVVRIEHYITLETFVKSKYPWLSENES